MLGAAGGLVLLVSLGAALYWPQAAQTSCRIEAQFFSLGHRFGSRALARQGGGEGFFGDEGFRGAGDAAFVEEGEGIAFGG